MQRPVFHNLVVGTHSASVHDPRYDDKRVRLLNPADVGFVGSPYWAAFRTACAAGGATESNAIAALRTAARAGFSSVLRGSYAGIAADIEAILPYTTDYDPFTVVGGNEALTMKTAVLALTVLALAARDEAVDFAPFGPYYDGSVQSSYVQIANPVVTGFPSFFRRWQVCSPFEKHYVPAYQDDDTSEMDAARSGAAYGELVGRSGFAIPVLGLRNADSSLKTTVDSDVAWLRAYLSVAPGERAVGIWANISSQDDAATARAFFDTLRAAISV